MPKLPFVIGTGTLYLPPPPIVGTDFDDTIYGTANADEIYGRKGHDTLFGGAGNDWLFGEEGDDLLCGGIGADRLDGGIGSDTADYTNSAAGVNVNLATNAAPAATPRAIRSSASRTSTGRTTTTSCRAPTTPTC